MIYKETQQKSLLDFLVQIMPDWQDQVTEFKKSPRYLVNGKAAKTLFALWKDEGNKVDNKILKRPTSVSLADVKEMQHAGLIRDLGDKIEVTKKGSDVIQTMILGDDKSIWEDDGKTLNFETAYANTKRRGKTARKAACDDVEKIDVDKNVDNQDEEKGVNEPVGDDEEPKPEGNWYRRPEEPMKIITVRSTRSTKSKMVETTKTHLWYDTKTKTMKKLVGGQLSFGYDPATKSSTVSVEKAYERRKVDRSSIWSIRQWFEENGDDYKLTLVDDTDTHMSFALPPKADDNDVKAVESALYRERFDFTVEDHDA